MKIFDRMKKIIFSFLALFLMLPASGQIPHAQFRGDQIPKKWLEKLEPLVNHEIEFYRPLGLAEDFSIRIWAFKDRKTGYDTIGKIVGRHKWVSESGLETAGVFIPPKNVVAIFGFDGEQDRMVSLIAHEINHSLFHQTFPRKTLTPTWLNEGLSEYFENCSVSRKGVVKHEFPDYDKGRLKTKYMLGEIKLAEFVDYGYKEFMQMEHSDDMSAYRMAHAIVTFLIEKEVFQDCFKAIAGRSREETPSMMLGSAYPGGLSAFEADFRAFILQKK